MYLVIVSCIHYEKVNIRVRYKRSQESESLQSCIVKSDLWISYPAYFAFKETPYRGMSRDAATVSSLKENVAPLPPYDPCLDTSLPSCIQI